MSETSSEDIEFLYLLASLYMQQSKYDKALPLFQVIRLQNPSNHKIVLCLSICLYKLGKFNEAKNVITSIKISWLSKTTQAAFLYINSKIFWELGDKQASRDCLNQYLKLR